MGLKRRAGYVLERKWKIGDEVSLRTDEGKKYPPHWKIVGKELSKHGLDARGRPYILYTLEAIKTPDVSVPWYLLEKVAGERYKALGANLLKAGAIERVQHIKKIEEERMKAKVAQGKIRLLSKTPRITPKRPKLRR